MKRKNLLITLMFMLLQVAIFAQGRVVTGTVKDATTGQPIFGVAVGAKNSTIGMFTNPDGQFSLTVPDSVKVLYFKLIGYKPKEVAVTDAPMKVSLTQDALLLEETVVTANAIARPKRSLGYSTQTVSSDELTKGQNTSVLGSLQGKISGVNITSATGGPGGSTRVVLRGGTSLTGNNQALIVVDGVPIDNSNFGTGDDLNNQVDYGNRGNDINPDDIESISVLKGPAAAALYGSRASNGAIVITTKSGRSMTEENKKLDIAYSTNLMLSSVLKLPKFQNEYGQGDVYPGRDPQDRRENFSWGLPFDGEDRPWGQQINGQQRVKKYEALPNNVKDFFVTGTTYNHNLSVSGGNDKSTFYLSLGALRNKGVIETTGYNKYSVRFNGTTNLTNNFSSSVSANYSSVNSSLPGGGQGDASIFNGLIQTPRDIPIIEGKDLNDPFNLQDDAAGTYGFYGAYANNPYFVLKNFRNNNKVDRLQGNVSLSFHKWDWLNIVERMGGDIYADRRYQKWKKYSYSPIDQYWAGNDKVYQGRYSEDLYNLNEITNDLMLNFKHDFNKDFKLSGVLGHNVRQRTLTNTYAQTNEQGGLAIADYYNLANSNGTPITTNATFKRRLIGAYLEANAAYKNMLFLGITGRNDWSSTLPKENRSFFYPSVNAAWVFSELFSDSLKNNKWTFGKIRASYASVGNDADPYLTTSVFNKTNIDGGFGSTTLPFNNVNGYTQGDRVGNPQIKPEITTAVEVGAELGFLKDRLGLDVSYYMNRSKNQIINVPLSNTTGYTSKTINTGEIENKGIELLLRGTPILTASGLKVDLYATFTKNKNKVLSINEGIDQITLGGFSRMAIVAAVGQPYGTFYGTDLLKDGNGNVVVDSASGLPLTTPNSVYFGSYQPKFTASLGANLTYKLFSFNILFDTKQGGVFYSRTKSTMDFVGTALETTDQGRGDRVWENSVYQDYQGNYVSNTTPYNVEDYYTNRIPDGQHLVDASYVKLREIAMSYKFPTKWLTKTPLGSVVVGLFANNLFIWTNKDNLYSDPEMNSSGSGNVQGFEFSATPSQRNYGLNLKVTF